MDATPHIAIPLFTTTDRVRHGWPLDSRFIEEFWLPILEVNLDIVPDCDRHAIQVTPNRLFCPSRPHAPRGPHPVRTAAGPTSRRQAAPRRTQSGSATFNRAGDDHRRLATALASNERGRWSGRRLGWGVTPGPGRGVWAAIEAQRRAALQSPKPKEIL